MIEGNNYSPTNLGEGLSNAVDIEKLVCDAKKQFATSLPMSLNDQMLFNRNLWAVVGVTIPEVPSLVIDGITKVLQEKPNLRLVVSGLWSIEDRYLVPERFKKALPLVQPDPSRPILSKPNSDSIYAKFVKKQEEFKFRDPQGEPKEYIPLYKVSKDEVVEGRKNFIEGLLDRGLAFEDNNLFKPQTITYPLIDIETDTPRLGISAKDCYDLVSPLATPETHIIVQIIQALSNKSNEFADIDLVNEAFCQKDLESKKSLPDFIAGIRWRRLIGSIGIHEYSPKDRREGFGIREIVNPLN